MSSPVFHPSSQWPVAGEHDVIVVGAGPAGIAAACAAAATGQNTLIIDRAAFAGGVATGCCCPYLMGFAHEDRQIAGGFADELVRRMAENGYAAFIQRPASIPDPTPIGQKPLVQNVIISPEGLRLTVNRLFDHYGVRRLFYTQAIGALTTADRLEAVAVIMREGPALLRARCFVDATGDAELVHLAGGKTRISPPEYAMTKTILIRVGGVEDFYRPRVEEAFNACLANGNIPFTNQDHFMGLGLLNPGEVLLNFTLVIGDGLSSADLTRMDQELREQIPVTLDFFRTHIPGFRDCFLVDSAHRVGVRAGRSIIGHETITAADLNAGSPVDEPVALGTRNYGGHGLDAFHPPWHTVNPGVRAIPWKALLPVSFRNVAAGGRAISAEAMVLDAFRLMARCMTIGQAAGVCVALAAAEDGDITTLPYASVRETLLVQGAILEV